MFFIIQENITYIRNIKKYLFVDLYNVSCTIRAIGKILTTQKYKEIKFEIFLNMKNNTQNTIIRPQNVDIRSLHLSFVLLQ